MTDQTDYHYHLLMEGKMDMMFLPAGAVAWLWQYNRPQAQSDSAALVASASKRAGNPVVDAALLRADQNILVLHLQSGSRINVYPDGGYGSGGEPIDRSELDSFINGSVYDDDPVLGDLEIREPSVGMPDDLDMVGIPQDEILKHSQI